MNIQYLCHILYVLFRTHLILSVVFSVIRVIQVKKILKERENTGHLPDGTSERQKELLDMAIQRIETIRHTLGDYAQIVQLLTMFIGIFITFVCTLRYINWIYDGITQPNKKSK